MSDSEHKDAFGRLKVYSSSKPLGWLTYFTGTGDDLTDPQNPVIGGGNELSFELSDTDASISVDLTFSEDVYIKDGHLVVDGAPFGAKFDIAIVHPQAGVLAYYARNCPLLSSWAVPLDTDDRGLVNLGLILRVTVHNAPTKAAFKVSGRIEMFRQTTV